MGGLQPLVTRQAQAQLYCPFLWEDRHGLSSPDHEQGGYQSGRSTPPTRGPY